MKLFLFLIFSILNSQFIFSQFYFLNQSKGLPCNYFEDIYKSSDGFLWLITGNEGVLKYDGNSFMQYTRKDGLFSNNCFDIAEDNKKRLWIANDTGITLYQNHHFYGFGTNNGFPANTSVYSIFCDSEDSVWIGAFNGSLIRFDGKMFHQIKSPFYPEQEIEFIGETKDHNLLLGNTYGLLYLFDKNNHWEDLNENSASKDLCCGINFMFTQEDGVIIGTALNILLYKTKNDIRKLIFDYKKWGSPFNIIREKDSTYWLITSYNNLLHIDLNDTVKILESVNLNRFTTDELLRFTKIKDIFFFTTYSSGILVYKHFPKTYFPYRQIGVKSVPTVLKTGKNDNLYFAGNSYFGIISHKKLSHFVNFDKIKYNITNILQLNDDCFLLAADGFGIINYNLKLNSIKYLQKKMPEYVTFFEKTKNDTIWVASEKLLIKYKDSSYSKYMLDNKDNIVPYNENTFVKSLLCQKILPDSTDNTVWIAAYNRLYHYKNGKFYQVKQSAIKNIFDIIFDRNHLLWITSNGNNLLRYNPVNNTVKNFSRFIQHAFNGIEYNSLYQLGIDAKNQLWINARIALQLDSNSNITNQHYYISHPYFNNNIICSLHDISSHYIWFATDRDIQQIPINSLYDVTKIPTPVITEIKINNKPSNVTKVNYNKNFWTFQFELPYFQTSHKNIIYYYRLIGIEDQWHMQKTNSPINYYHLEYGDYEFQLKAKFIDQHYFSDTVKYHFIITPPFWKTYWFIIIVIGILILIVFSIIHEKIRRIKEKAFITGRINRLKLKVVQSQIKPHFLFNFLNNIQDNIFNNERETIIEHLSILSKFIRQTLEYSDLNKITLTQELDYIKNYILIEKFRFNNEFEYHFQINENTDTVFLPPMLLQPLVENAIIHGLKPSQKEQKKLSVIFSGNSIEIIDNGVGLITEKDDKISYPEHHSKGLELLYEKIQVYSTIYPSGKIKFKIENIFENNQIAGTKATIKIIKND